MKRDISAALFSSSREPHCNQFHYTEDAVTPSDGRLDNSTATGRHHGFLLIAIRGVDTHYVYRPSAHQLQGQLSQ